MDTWVDRLEGGALRLAALLAVTIGMALLLTMLAFPVVFGAQRAVSFADNEIFDVPPLPEEIDPPAQISYMYDASGRQLAEIHGPVRRVPVELEHIPEVTRNAVIATEDAVFYEHDGVEHRAVARATVRNLQAGGVEEGASTITQQYVRSVLLSPEQTMERKLHEIVWAVELEERMSKDEILEGYLNAVYLGNGVYGFGTAAEYYFSKHVSELDIAESALLAGVIRAPRGNDPIANPEAAIQRRDIVLNQMVEHGFVSREEADEAMRRELELDIMEEEEVLEPFWVDWVKRVAADERIALQQDVQEALGETRDERLRTLFEGGIHIHTTLNPVVQDHAAAALARHLTSPRWHPLGALVSVQTDTGAVRAVAVGPKPFGECEDDEERCEVTKVNPAVPGGGGQFGRQAGSAFKPIVAAAALDRGLGTGRSYSTESGASIPGCGGPGDPYTPHNYDRSNHGQISMTQAMRRSTNVYFVKLARDTGVPNVVEKSHELGLLHSPNLNDEHFGPRSCSIGLGTVNVFPLEMAVAYATFENGGERCSPYAIERIEDRNGEVLYEAEPRCARALSSSVASSMRSVLPGPVRSGGTADIINARVPGDVWGKTGTTDRHIDAWLAGFVPGMATVAWVGYEEPAPMTGVRAASGYYSRVTGGSLPARIWADHMRATVIDPDAADAFGGS
jgi:penicillin-binding protein 1A